MTNLIEISDNDPKFPEVARQLVDNGYPDYEVAVMEAALKAWVVAQVDDLMDDLAGNAMGPRATIERYLAYEQHKADKKSKVSQ